MCEAPPSPSASHSSHPSESMCEAPPTPSASPCHDIPSASPSPTPCDADTMEGGHSHGHDGGSNKGQRSEPTA